MKFEQVLKTDIAPKKVFTISEELELYKAGLLDEGKKLKEEEDEKVEEKCDECGAELKDGECPKCDTVDEGCKSKKSKNESEDEEDEESEDEEMEDEEEPKDEGKKSKKAVKESEEINEEADVTKVIKALGDTDWGKDNEAQMKAVQLLKGIALSDDPKSNAFMKALSDASTGIAKKVLGTEETKEESKDATVSESASYAAELMDGPELSAPTKASTELTNYANDLM